MNKTFYLLLLAILAISCNQNNDEQTVIGGEFADTQGKILKLVPVKDYFPGSDIPEKNYPTDTVDENGKFQFVIDNFQEGFYQVIEEKWYKIPYDIYIEQGDSLNILVPKWNSDSTLQITGKGSEKLNYLVIDQKNHRFDNNFYDTIRSKGFPTELDFKAFIDSKYEPRRTSLANNASTPEELKETFLNELEAESAYFLLNHLERRNYNMTREFGYFYPDEKYLEDIVDFGQKDLKYQTHNVKMLANTYVNHKARLAFQDNSEEAWWEEKSKWKFDYIQAQPKSIWTDLLALSNELDYPMELTNDDFFDNLGSFIASSDTLMKDAENKSMLVSNAKNYLKLAPDEKAPDFELPDSAGVMHKLSDYKGKVVYIDFWGTWCYPCIQEIPNAIKLQEKYKDKPVEFIYIALEYGEENIEGWKTFIAGKDEGLGKILEGKPFPGVHLVAEKQFHNKEIAPYQINFAPTFVLIDQEGKMVKARAERPDEISEQLDKLLDELKG